jgi:hypothetical protein
MFHLCGILAPFAPFLASSFEARFDLREGELGRIGNYSSLLRHRH